MNNAGMNHLRSLDPWLIRANPFHGVSHAEACLRFILSRKKKEEDGLAQIYLHAQIRDLNGRALAGASFELTSEVIVSLVNPCRPPVYVVTVGEALCPSGAA
jgi:hypothetical protein